MPAIRTALSPHAQWMDEGYAYAVAAVRQEGAIALEVTRRLALGRMSPIVGRRVFEMEQEEALACILGTMGPARTYLVDEIIRGGEVEPAELAAAIS